jgi:hypothetical protein
MLSNFFFPGYSKKIGQFGFFFLPYQVGQIIKVERNFTYAQNFGHSGKTLMLKQNSCFFFFFFFSLVKWDNLTHIQYAPLLLNMVPNFSSFQSNIKYNILKKKKEKTKFISQFSQCRLFHTSSLYAWGPNYTLPFHNRLQFI